MTIDYQIILTQLPGKTREAVAANEDGSYTIFVEDTLSPEYKRKAVLHALAHIQDNDFNNADVQEIESSTHKKF